MKVCLDVYVWEGVCRCGCDGGWLFVCAVAGECLWLCGFGHGSGCVRGRVVVSGSGLVCDEAGEVLEEVDRCGCRLG